MHKRIKDDFVKRLVEKTRGIKLGDPLSDHTQMGAMISPAQAQKVLDFIDIAKKEVNRVCVFCNTCYNFR